MEQTVFNISARDDGYPCKQTDTYETHHAKI